MIRKNALRRRLWISLGVLAFLLATIVGISYSIVRYQGIRDLKLALAETDKLDPNWRLEDLEAHRPPMPPPGTNGFVQVSAAAEAMPAGNWPSPRFPEFDNDLDYQQAAVNAINSRLENHDRMAPVLLDEEETRVLRAELERAHVAIGMVRRMADFPLGRNPSMPRFQGNVSSAGSVYVKVLKVAKMLGPDARVYLHDGNIAGAIRDVTAMLHISRALKDEPDVIAQLVRAAIDDRAIDMLERTLAGGAASEQQLAALQKELEEELAAPKLSGALRGLRALTDRELEDAQSGAISSSELHAQLFPGAGLDLPTRFLLAIRSTLVCGNLAGERAYG